MFHPELLNEIRAGKTRRFKGPTQLDSVGPSRTTHRLPRLDSHSPKPFHLAHDVKLDSQKSTAINRPNTEKAAKLVPSSGMPDDRVFSAILFIHSGALFVHASEPFSFVRAYSDYSILPHNKRSSPGSPSNQFLYMLRGPDQT